MPEYFDINPYLDEMKDCLGVIHGIVIKDQLRGTVASVNYIVRMVELLKGEEGMPCIIRIEETESGDRLNVSTEQVPLNAVAFLLHAEAKISPGDSVLSSVKGWLSVEVALDG